MSSTIKKCYEINEKQAKSLKKLDRFFSRLYRHKGMSGSGAYDLGDIIGVLIGIKEVSVNYLFSFMLSGFARKRLTRYLNELGLEVQFEDYIDRKSGGEVKKFNHYTRYYVSKSKGNIAKLRGMFVALDSGATKEINRSIAEMLGYPESAIDYCLNHRDSKRESEEQNKRGYVLAAFYVHSLDNVDAEFEAYEKPIFAVMEEYCPKVWVNFVKTKVVLPSGDELRLRTE